MTTAGTSLRAIVAFPAFADPDAARQIEELRRRFDPLAAAIPAHLTLVFPFAAALPPGDLLAHVRAAVRELAPFPIVLQGITGSEDEYLFLNVKRGNDELIDLHDRLHSGPLADHRSREHTFVPHLTISRLGSSAAFRAALDATRVVDTRFEAEVRELAIYHIVPDGAGSSRMVEHVVSL